jgi:hypothetical protein
LIQKIKTRFFAVFGANVRQYRNEIKTLPGVQLAFPIGLRLNVWLEDSQTLEEFQQALRSLSSDITVEPQQPSLHDAALHDLAMAEQDGRYAGS